MEPCVSPGIPSQMMLPMSPLVRQQSQGSDGGVVVRRRSLCFTPRSVSLPMTPTVSYSRRPSFSDSNGSGNGMLHGTPHGFQVYTRAGSMTIPPVTSATSATSATSVSQWSRGANLIPQTPKDAFHSLQMGNSRSVKGVRRFPAPATGPFATIVACTDCPRAAEAIFDAQPGSLFVTTLHGCYGSSEGWTLLDHSAMMVKQCTVTHDKHDRPCY